MGAGTDNNIFARAHRKLIPTLQDGLDSFEGDTNTVANVISRLMERALDRVGLLRSNSVVTAECFKPISNISADVKKIACRKDDPENKPTSIMWTVPLGQVFEVELPMDFDLSTGKFPLEVEFDGDNNKVPTFKVGWEFSLAFGFDEKDGFFLYTFPGRSDEFNVYCLLSVPDRTLTATLFFLEAKLVDLDIFVGAKMFVGLKDLDNNPNGRLTSGDIKNLNRPSDLFSIGALAGATVGVNKANFSVNTAFLGSFGKDLKPWIPHLDAKIFSQVRKEVGTLVKNPKSTRRQLVDGEEVLVFSEPHLMDGHSNHPAHPILRSLEADKLIEPGYNFADCELNTTEKEIFCIKVKEIILRMEKLRDAIYPILSEFVDPGEENGYLDKVMNPAVLFLDERIGGLSDIIGKKLTILDIAETWLGEKSGAPTVRKIIEIYNKIRVFMEQFERDGGIRIADECDVLNSFHCKGGVFEDGGTRRLHIEAHVLFGYQDSAGLPISPNTDRELDGCPSFSKDNDCKGDCNNCDGVISKGKCYAKRVKCKANSIDGLSFPFMKNLPSLVGLLAGKDIVSAFFGLVYFDDMRCFDSNFLSLLSGSCALHPP